MEKGKSAVYYGETARTAYERGKEHWQDGEKGIEESHMWTHQQEQHEGDGEIRFGMKIVKAHNSAFSRQVHEAVEIILSKNQTILNSKQEYNRCILPKLAVQMGDKFEGNTEDNQKFKFTEKEEEESILLGAEQKRKEQTENTEPPRKSFKKRRRWKQEPPVKRGLEIVTNGREKRKKLEKEGRNEPLIRDIQEENLDCQKEEEIRSKVNPQLSVTQEQVQTNKPESFSEVYESIKIIQKSSRKFLEMTSFLSENKENVQNDASKMKVKLTHSQSPTHPKVYTFCAVTKNQKGGNI